jgi:Mg-chelatase subunit ChlD
MLVVGAVLAERRAERSRPGMLLRATLVGLIGLSLTQVVLTFGAASPTVWLAESSSLEEVMTALAPQDAGQAVPLVVSYGGDGEPELDLAMPAAAGLVAPGGQVVVVGSGAALGADPEEAVSAAARAGVRIHAVYREASGADVAVTGLYVPASWRSGREIPVHAAIRGSRPSTATLSVIVDGTTVQAIPVSVDARLQSTVQATVPGAGAGRRHIVVRVRMPGDIEPRNDSADAVVTVAAPLQVLVVGEDEGALLLAEALTSSGFRVDHMTPDRLPSRLSQLGAWDVLALVDVSADSLGADQRAAVEAFVADLGRGVIMTAGRQSFTAGSWSSTRLAEMAPVELRPPTREAREPVALILMVDQSASMGTLQGRTAISKLDLALEAAVLASEVLQAGDWVGVVAYADTARWLLPPAEIDAALDLESVEEALRGLRSGGGTSLASALDLGLPALRSLSAPTRHAVLVSDGRDFAPNVELLEEAVRQARRSGATVSTIAVGFDADRQLLARLSSLGHGRQYVADDPAELPRLAVEESEIISARTDQTGSFQLVPAPGPPHAALADVDVSALPRLEGYVALRPRPDAHVALAVQSGDPVLVTWSFGLGRVAAWLSDVGEDWAWEWPGAREPARLWASLADYVAPAAGAGPPGVRAWLEGDSLRVTADALDAWGQTIDLADVTLTVTDVLRSVSTTLPQRAPGLYASAITAPRTAASGSVVVAESGFARSASFAVQQRPPLELRPAAAGRERLAHLAEAGGGRLLDRMVPAPAPTRVALSPWLLLLGCLLLPLDVAEQLGLTDRLPAAFPRPRWRTTKRAKERSHR